MSGITTGSCSGCCPRSNDLEADLARPCFSPPFRRDVVDSVVIGDLQADQGEIMPQPDNDSCHAHAAMPLLCLQWPLAHP